MRNFVNLVHAARSCRRFVEDKPVSRETLRDIVDCARTVSSALNKQPLRYITVTEPETVAKVFSHTNWASVLKWGGPFEGERPTGFIAMLTDEALGKPVFCDMGIAGQTMQLYATSQGLGCCMLNNFPRGPVREILGIPEETEILLLFGFGVAKEVRRIAEAKPGESLQYWRDAEGVHHVPKRSLSEVLLAEK